MILRIAIRNTSRLSGRRPCLYRLYSGDAQGTTQGPPFKVMFFGNDEFSVDVLKALYAAKDVWSDLWVVTSHNQTTGRRGKDLYVPPLRSWSEERELKTGQFPFGDRADSALDNGAANLLVTASFGQILPKNILRRFNEGRQLNVHPSLLPLLRGPAPIQWALAQGLKETGVSIIQMLEKGIDNGPILAQERVAISPNDTFSSLREKLAAIAGEEIVNVLRDLMMGKATARSQEGVATYAPKIEHQMTLVNWMTDSAVDLDRKHRAFGHQYPLYSLLPVSLSESVPVDPSRTQKYPQSTTPPVQRVVQFFSVRPSSSPTPGLNEAGEAIFVSDTGDLHIRCIADGEIRVQRLKVQNHKEVTAKDWWNGLRTKSVVRFGDLQPD